MGVVVVAVVVAVVVVVVAVVVVVVVVVVVAVVVVVVVGVYGMIALGEGRLPWRRGDNIGCGFLFKGVVFVDVGC